MPMTADLEPRLLTNGTSGIEGCETAGIAGDLTGRASFPSHAGLKPCALRARPFRPKGLFCATIGEFPWRLTHRFLAPLLITP